MTRASYIVVMSLLLATPALAACPPQATANLGEAIKDNGSRIVCLQRELTEEANRLKLDMDVMALQRQLQQIELQQKLNAIPAPVILPVPMMPQPML